MAEQHTQTKKSNIKRNFFLLIVGVIILNVVVYQWNIRFDLTNDKRFTTTESTQNLLKNLQDPIRISIFLTGRDMPAAFQRLAHASQDVAANFKTLANGKLDVWTLDPNGDDTTIYNVITKFGMEGMPVTIDAGKQGTKQKMIFPWVLVENTATGAAVPVFIQESNSPKLSRTILNKSEILLEYNIANAIHLVAQKERAKVGLLMGNSQVLGYNVMSAIGDLANYYILDTVNVKMVPAIPSAFNTLIVTTSTEAFTETDKFKLDQYLMQGGNIIYLLNQASGSLDSFKQTGSYNIIPIDVNLSDLLFHYGVRVNTDLLSDGLSYTGVPLSKTGRMEDSEMYPWIYFPVLQGNNEHVITKNLDGVLSRFASSIDLIDQQAPVTKTVLLHTSKYSKKNALPKALALTDAVVQFNVNEFHQPNIPVAVLLEGTFSSHYAQRLPEEVAAHLQLHAAPVLKESNAKGKIVVVGDGDIIYNDMGPQGPLELGQYIYGNYKFDNKSFLLNTVEYLSNVNNLLEARNKSFTSRVLDPKRVQAEKGMWQLINIGVPSLLIILLGGVWTFVRKRKYA